MGNPFVPAGVAEPACEPNGVGAAISTLSDGTCSQPIQASWGLRSVAANDSMLRGSFQWLLEESEAASSDGERLVMYDACDGDELSESIEGLPRFLPPLASLHFTPSPFAFPFCLLS